MNENKIENGQQGISYNVTQIYLGFLIFIYKTKL
jgi:hypothetical protein